MNQYPPTNSPVTKRHPQYNTLRPVDKLFWIWMWMIIADLYHAFVPWNLTFRTTAREELVAAAYYWLVVALVKS